MKRFFTKRKIPFEEKDILLDKGAYREWRDRWGGDIVPLIVFGNGERVVDGCDIDKIEKALKEGTGQ